MLGRPILTKQELDEHRTTVGPISDVIWAPLYDANSYIATTGHLQLTFFALPLGQGTTSAPGAAGTKTLADTNLNAAGQLTKGNEFYMTGQEIVFFPGVNPGTVQSNTVVGNFINDTWVFNKSGFLTLQVGSNRQYIQDGPMAVFPPVTRLAVASALAGAVTGAATTQNLDEVTYAVASGEPYSITPIYIESTQGFQEVLQWPAAVTLPSGSNARVFSRLRGYLIRDAQ